MDKLFGTDPEVFAVNRLGYCIPPVLLREEGMKTYGLQDADEQEPRHPIFYKDDSITIIEDGALFEFNIKPSDNPEVIFNEVSRGKSILQDLLNPFNLFISDRPVAPFNSQVLFVDGVASAYRTWCCRFGCDKDYDIYAGIYSKDIDATKVNERFAGGHLHMSPVNHDYYEPFTQLLDCIVGNTFISITPYPEEEAKRQLFYGRPGKIRLPVYPNGVTGLEYRTPSISWLHDLNSVKIMIRNASFAMDIFNDNPKETMNIIDKFLSKSIQNILTFDIFGAYSILREIGLSND